MGFARLCARCWLPHPLFCEPSIDQIPKRAHERGGLGHVVPGQIKYLRKHPDLHEYDGVGSAKVEQAQVEVRALSRRKGTANTRVSEQRQEYKEDGMNQIKKQELIYTELRYYVMFILSQLII